MKFDIDWHKGCCERQGNSLTEKRARLKANMKDLEKQEHNHSFYSAQIDLAIKEGKDGFDRDRYGYKKLINI